jgi:hypothetical protein
MEFYLAPDAYGSACIWHDIDGYPHKPDPVICEYQVAAEYWDELVRRLTGEES